MARPRLTERNRLIVELHDREGKSFTEIGKIFKIYRATAYASYRRTKEGRWPIPRKKEEA